MTSPNANLMRAVMDFADSDNGPDALAAAMFAHPEIGPLLPFRFELIRGQLEAAQDARRRQAQHMAAALAAELAKGLRESLR